MASSNSVSQYYRKKLEQHELTPEEWAAVRFAVLKHTVIAAATTVTLGVSAFYYAGNVIGLSLGGVIAMESGMKTVEGRLQGSGSQLLYLMDRYSKATLREKLGDQSTSSLDDGSEQPLTAPRMIRVQESDEQK
ncbi:hypothetical protein EC968_009216 [Mortierella alpina]|nr:hypothetical protein EC968_009216 [Mortierella alpina]